MKKRILSMLLCCLMLFGLVFTVSADPDQPEVDPVAHAITVKAENGTATASAETAVAGTEITLEAKANEGYKFKEWQILSEASVVQDGDKFTMPDADVEVIAVFEKLAEHSITVKPSKMGKAYSNPKTAIAGTEIVLTAEPDSGYFFAGWKVVKGDITIASDKFIMPDEDVEVKAIFAAEHKIIVLKDENGEEAFATPSAAIAGTEITLTAKGKPGYRLKEWQVIRGSVEIKDGKFVMPDEDVTVKAIFEEVEDDMGVIRDIHFVLVKTDGNGVGVAYPPYSEAGTKVTVVAIAKPGYKFKEWKVVKGGVKLENKSVTTFEMPAENVILEAIFESDGTEGDKPTLPDIPKPDKPGTPDKPGNPETPDVPDTGDTTNVLLWAAALVIGGGAAIGTVVSKKKKKEES